MRRLIIGAISTLAVAAASPTPSTGQARITSAFTKTDNCTSLAERAEEYEVQRCKGVAGVPLFIQDGDNRFDISAGVNDDGEDFCGSPSCAFNYPGDTVEWRLLGGKPFAIIFRIITDPADWGETKLKKSSLLMVETIGKKPCRVAEIPGDTPNANAAARKAADLILTGKARCIDFEERRRRQAAR